jgi:CubicO group peptidase (beta-lactamase class C family)
MTVSLHRTLSLVLFAGFTATAIGQPPAAPSAPAAPPAPVLSVVLTDHHAETAALVAREMEKQGLVGLSLAVLKDGKVVFEHHAGFEDRENKVAASEATMYRWASISKPVTATAVMLLVDAGKFDLDADVRTLVPEFPAPVLAAAASGAPASPLSSSQPLVITPRELLCHQGGIVHYSNGKVVALPVPKEPEHPYADVVKALDTFKMSPLVCEPGTKYSYTTHGYMLLGAAVQGAAGRSYWSVVKDWIAIPAGMTTFRPDYQWEKIDHRAVGYVKPKAAAAGADGVVPPMPPAKKSTDTDVSWKLPGGGFISTVGDLARFSGALMEGAILQPETFAKMRVPQKTRDGQVTGYGLGLGIGKLKVGEKEFATASHSGSQEKSATYLLMLPEKHFSVAIMCNTEGASLGPLGDAVVREWLK